MTLKFELFQLAYLRVFDATEAIFDSKTDGIIHIRQMIRPITNYFSFVIKTRKLSRCFHIIL
jgi:hypothetical protein